MSDDFKDYHATWKSRINRYCEEYLSARNVKNAPLGAAVTYSLTPGGKRLRPLLTVAASEAFGVDGEEALPFACAVEMIHTFSLIHDDLPAMDGHDMRRGKPAAHKVYGEGQAVLAGNVLLVEAFRLMSETTLDRTLVLDVIRFVSTALGLEGMAAGQSRDLSSTEKAVGIEELESMYRAKTGRLFAVAAYAGAAVGRAGQEPRQRLADFGQDLGFAFQIVDDVLDRKTREEPDSEAEHWKKPSYPEIVGADKAMERAEEIVEGAKARLEELECRTGRLIQIAEFVVSRKT